MIQYHKKVRFISDDTILFHEETYLKIGRLSVQSVPPAERTALFDEFFAFSHPDIDMEIDVSDEEKGYWYLQLLVPAMLTLPESAQKRLTRGSEGLKEFFHENNIDMEFSFLSGEEIFRYIKRYNPDALMET